MRRIFFAAFAFFVFGFLAGQNDQVEIKGKILSNKKQSVLHAEVFLRIKDSVYKVITDENGEFKFTAKKSNEVAELYVNSTNRTKSGAAKKTCFLADRTNYKIKLAEKIEPSYDFELIRSNIYYSSPVILFGPNSPNTIVEVKYGNVTAKIDEVITYFSNLIKEYPKAVLEIMGMMSNDEKSNNLALLRAKFVQELLVKKGVSTDNMKYGSRGTFMPDIKYSVIKEAKTKEEIERLQSLNRRVIIKVITFGDGVVGNRTDDD